MSVATLKKKTFRGGNPRVDPISGIGQNGFSLNGCLRNIGGVGQFRMVSNVTRTLFRGNTPVGWGGCCGTYPQYIANSGNCCKINDSSIVKLSTKNTKGMLDEKYLGILHGAYPNTWVKDDDNSYRITDTQSQYIESLSWKAGSCKFQANARGNTTVADAEVCKCSQGKFYHIGGKKYRFYNPTTKFVGGYTTQGQYITTGGVAKNNYLPTPPCARPFPYSLAHNGCDVNYNTIEQAAGRGYIAPLI
jgi:hypothetical protein